MFCHINIGSHFLHLLSTFFISRQLRNSLYLSWYFCALRIILQSCLESSQSLHNTWWTLGISAVEYQKSCGLVHNATRNNGKSEQTSRHTSSYCSMASNMHPFLKYPWRWIKVEHLDKHFFFTGEMTIKENKIINLSKVCWLLNEILWRKKK